MKRIMTLGIVLCLLAGCGFSKDNVYVSVSPHNEEYGVSQESDVLTVSSYLSLKNALLNVVQDGAGEAVLRTDAYPGNLGEDLNQAVYEVTKMSPVGAYGVSSLTYDFTRVVSYYEIHVNVNYQRTKEELQAVSEITTMDTLPQRIQESMEEYAPRLVMRVGDYEAPDLAEMIEQVCLDHPEFALEQPKASITLYPDSGAQRIMEIHFNYVHTQKELVQMQQELDAQLSRLKALYGSSNNALTNARRLYLRVGRDAVLDTKAEEPVLELGPYSVLVERHAGSYGFAQTYRLLLDRSGIPCRLVAGQKDGEPHYWCLLELDGAACYADPSMSAGGNEAEDFLMGTAELESRGYALWNTEEYPEVELPWGLRPPPKE